jgi:hypothetical protein
MLNNKIRYTAKPDIYLFFKYIKQECTLHLAITQIELNSYEGDKTDIEV